MDKMVIGIMYLLQRELVVILQTAVAEYNIKNALCQCVQYWNPAGHQPKCFKNLM